MIALSYSGMKDLQCPFRFNALKVSKTYTEPVTDILLLGSAVADCLAEYRRHCIINELPSDLSFFNELSKWAPNGLDERFADLIESFKTSEFASIKLDATELHVESQPALEYWKIGGFAFDANLDFIGSNKSAWLHERTAFRLKSDFCYVADNTLHIIDDKTGYGDGDEQQLAIYALLIHSALQLDDSTKIVGTFNNIAKRTTNQYEFSVQDLYPLRETILNAIRDVNTRTEWPAIACDRCGFCTVPGCTIRVDVETALTNREAQPRAPVLSIPSSIECVQDAEKALLFVLFCDGIKDRVKELLRDWVDGHGPVSIAGKVAGYTERETVKAKDLAQLCSALVQFGAPKELVWNNLSLTKDALAKIVKRAKLEAKQAWIDAYLERSTSRSFGIQNDKTF